MDFVGHFQGGLLQAQRQNPLGAGIHALSQAQPRYRIVRVVSMRSSLSNPSLRYRKITVSKSCSNQIFPLLEHKCEFPLQGKGTFGLKERGVGYGVTDQALHLSRGATVIAPQYRNICPQLRMLIGWIQTGCVA